MSHSEEVSSYDEASRVDRLLDAIDLVKSDRREDALPILRDLIHDDSDFEDAWLWMSVAVDSVDQSILCLDNVLRINPNNFQAAGALYRLRESEMVIEKRRLHLRMWRDMAMILMWVLIMFLLFGSLYTFYVLSSTYGSGA